MSGSTNSPLETRPNPTAWRELLEKALPALDHVFGRRDDIDSPPAWTLGGGTAIALRIGHRLSDDIDLFTPSVGLKAFTPFHNPEAAKISRKYQWPGHYLKFECENGEIDFLSPHLQTEPGFTRERFHDRWIALETLEEVIVKKIRFRAARFTARDIFDLAAVGRSVEALPEILAREVGDVLPRLAAVIAARAQAETDVTAGVRPMPRFNDLARAAHVEAARIVEKARFLARER